MKIKTLVVALLSLSLASFAAGQTDTTQATRTASNKTTTNTSKQALKSGDLNSPAAIKDRIKYLKRRLSRINNDYDQPKGSFDWYKYIQFSGLINVDASHWSKPNFGQGTSDTNASSYISLSEALLNVDAEAGDWVQGHLSLLYTNGSSPSVTNFSPDIRVNRRLNVYEAYGTLSNFAKTPFYLRAGQEFVPFGRYHLYPITKPLTQVLSQTGLPTVQAGFISQSGVYASAFTSSGVKQTGRSNSNQINVYGATAGYENLNHPVGYDLGLGYLSNMADVDAIRRFIKKVNGYTDSVGALSAFGDVYAGPFGFNARYVTALKRFNRTDYQYTHDGKSKGAKPYAVGVGADYNFQTFAKNSRLDIGYQWSGQAHNTATTLPLDDVTRLPKNRWLVGYGINLVRHLALELQFYREKDYSRNDGGTGRYNNVETARLSFLF